MRCRYMIVVLCVIGLVMPVAAAQIDSSEFEPGIRAAFQGEWRQMPAWLGNPSKQASLRAAGGAGVFKVPEPEMGMKWRWAVRQGVAEDARYLVFVYRARNVEPRGDFAVLLRIDGADNSPIRLDQLVCDGRAHRIVVPIGVGLIETVAVQVQATGAGRAMLAVDELGLVPEPPGAERPPLKEWRVDLANAKWIAQKSRLPKPSERHEVLVEDDGTTFAVGEPLRGMKWSLDLGRAVDIRPHRYVVMRYTAEDVTPSGDYTLCVVGAGGHASVIEPGEVVIGGMQTAIAPLEDAVRRHPSIRQLAVQVQALTGNANLRIHELRFVSRREPLPVGDVLHHFAGRWRDGYSAANLDNLRNCDIAPVLRRLHLKDWPQAETIVAWLAPFRLKRGTPQLYSTTFAGRERLAVPVAVGARGVYLLVFGLYRGLDEPMFGTGRLRTIRDVDRFRVRVLYEDGSADDWVPYNFETEAHEVSTGCLTTSRPRRMRSAVACRCSTCRSTGSGRRSK